MRATVSPCKVVSLLLKYIQLFQRNVNMFRDFFEKLSNNSVPSENAEQNFLEKD